MRFTDTGKAIRAVAKEKLGAELSGIDVAHIYAVTFGLGTACLAVAACLLLPTYYVNPHAGNAFVLVAFTIVVLGGMGSVAGALVGGLSSAWSKACAGSTSANPRPDRHLRHLHPRAAVPPDRPVRRARVKRYGIIFCGRAARLRAAVTSSNVVLNFLVVALLIALVGQGWNVLGGYGGQYSFGHAAFFGTAAYTTGILQLHYGVNAWAGLALGIAAGTLVGAVTGALSLPLWPARLLLRAGHARLRRSAAHHRERRADHRRGRRHADKLDLRWEAFQFQSRAPFYWIILAFVAVSLVIAQRLEQSRFGAYLVAIRENEDAARAAGIDMFRVKLAAMTLSAAITARGRLLLCAVFPLPRRRHRLRPVDLGRCAARADHRRHRHGVRPAARRAGGKALGEVTKHLIGDAPGLDLVIFGCVLILVVAFAPRGIAGLS